MSVLGKLWKIKNSKQQVQTLEKLLENRNILSKKEKISFLRADFESENHSPFLFRDMNKAVNRIYEAIKKGEKIIVFGDYDVDGISGTAIVVHVIKALGGTVSYRLPHRVNDGYGLNKTFVEEFKEIELGVLITVDCGISCANEVSLARDYGIDTIVTDHHSIPEKMPDAAYAILHPLHKNENYPFKHLTGAGVALKLGQALLEKSELENREFHGELIVKFASLGTVADLGPLYGENRTIVKRGLDLLGSSDWKGLMYLKKYSGIETGHEVTSTSIGYRLAPRINAAGRIGTPYVALQLLLKNDEEAETLAEKLDQLNRKRQVMTAKALEIAEQVLDSQLQEELMLVAHSDQWHTGILGLLAGRLAEKYYRPTIIMEDRGDELVGSARSPENFSMIQALTEQKRLLSHFGGHKQAAGFSIKRENLEEFIKNIQNYAKNTIDKSTLKPHLNIDCELDFDEVDEDLYADIKDLEPFGMENDEPVFLIKGVMPTSPKLVGTNQNHVKFSAQQNGKTINAIGFNLGKFYDQLIKKDSIDIVCSLGVNRYLDKEDLQLKIIDFG